MEIYNDFTGCADEEVWRKSKRVAEDASVGKGVAPSAGAYSKRNRSALDDITNSYMLLPDQPERMVTRSSLRAAQSQACHGVSMGEAHEASSSQRWAAPREGSNAMALSPAGGSVVGVPERLLDRRGASPAIESVSAEQATVFQQDAINANNPQYCIEYVTEIFEHLISSENKLLPCSTYMDTVQHDINPVMRGILVDWLVEVAEEYKLSPENLYLSANYVDRFLSIMPVLRGRLQLVGVTCMLIASKYEEIFAPQVEDFVYITDSTYSATEVLQMEVTVLNALRFNLTAVTPHCFIKRLTTVMGLDEQNLHLSEYLAEITIQEFPYLCYKPSQIAASAVCLSLHTLYKDTMPSTLARVLAVWAVDMHVVHACCKELHMTHTRIYNKQRTLQASFEKYSHSKLSKVSLIPPRSTAPFS
mmetsp:Transcript_93412/g.136455  ORF Transcript_93412/g.136455 Transcript_93412/m.136455 type:complete len:418 (-) Transcript_93412:551-1804(-)